MTMREQARVQMSRKQCDLLGLAIAQLVDPAVQAELCRLHRKAVDEFAEDDAAIERYTDKAMNKFCLGNNDINIDSDASLSRGNDGVWVSAWLFVRYDPEDREDDDEREEDD